MVPVIGLKGQPCTKYACGKYIPYFGSIVGISMGTNTSGVWLWQGDGSARAKVMKKNMKLEGNGLESNNIMQEHTESQWRSQNIYVI